MRQVTYSYYYYQVADGLQVADVIHYRQYITYPEVVAGVNIPGNYEMVVPRAPTGQVRAIQALNQILVTDQFRFHFDLESKTDPIKSYSNTESLLTGKSGS